MTDNLSPGFHVEEQPSQEQAIPAAPASVTAFVGRTCRGPLNQAVKINSYREYTETFGGFWKRSPLSYAVDQFFDNGGRDAIIVRIINAGRCASIVLPCGYEKLVLRAVHAGAHEAPDTKKEGGQDEGGEQPCRERGREAGGEEERPA